MLGLMVDSFIWGTVTTLVSQIIAVVLLWQLGLSPKKLRHEIEDVQNPAVGALFFIITLVTAIVIGILTASPSEADGALENIAWIGSGLIWAILLSGISVYVAHYVLEPIEGETVYTYLQREIILEQNASLAFVLGGLVAACFISVFAHVI